MSRIGRKIIEKQQRMYGRQAERERPKIPDAMKKLREDTLALGDTRPNNVVVAGWSVSLTIDLESKLAKGLLADAGKPCPTCDHKHFHMSARLVPLGRPSHDEDWVNLGIIAKAIGAPKSEQSDASIRTFNPSIQACHFIWREPDTACPLKAMAEFQPPKKAAVN